MEEHVVLIKHACIWDIAAAQAATLPFLAKHSLDHRVMWLFELSDLVPAGPRLVIPDIYLETLPLTSVPVAAGTRYGRNIPGYQRPRSKRNTDCSSRKQSHLGHSKQRQQEATQLDLSQTEVLSGLFWKL